MMVRHLISLLAGATIVVTGIVLKPHLIALGYWGPYEMVALMWLAIIASLMIWHRTRRTQIVSGVVISSMICATIVAYLFNHWLGFAVGTMCLYLVSRWLEKSKDRPSS
jgi:hypothetical protein